MLEVLTLTQGKLRLNAGPLYRSIKQLLAAGLIQEGDERPDPALDEEPRRFYWLTDFGRRVAETEIARRERGPKGTGM